MIRDIYLNNVLRERWNDDTHIVTFYNASGQQASQRPYTPAEIAEADIRAADVVAEAAARQEQIDAEAAAALARAADELADPPDGGPWVQPTGVQDAYRLNSEVTHNGKTWTSLTPFNVWEPGVSGWREKTSSGYPDWVQPTGAHDAYGIGDRVRHNNQNWESTQASNVWEPGAFGWTVIA